MVITGHPVTDKEELLIVTGGHHGDRSHLNEMGCQLGITPEVLSPIKKAIGCLDSFWMK